jgi:hypothetical protein
MEPRSITLYTRPECELCAETLHALHHIAATATIPLVITEVNVEENPALHQRLLAEIPAIGYGERILSHATSRLRIEAFISATDEERLREAKHHV